MESTLSNVLKLSKLRKSQVARRLGVSRARVSQMMTGHGRLTFKTITEFCHCCGYAVDLKLTPIKTGSVSGSIPENLRGLFWDTDFSHLDPLLHKEYILSRVLGRGNMEAVHWIKQYYSKRQILTHISKNLPRMDAKSLNFWAFIYGKEKQWLQHPMPASESSWQRLPIVKA
ncbi:MAG: helix-turn-helix transcriptional regulator [Fibrobacterota bacterium]